MCDPFCKAQQFPTDAAISLVVEGPAPSAPSSLLEASLILALSYSFSLTSTPSEDTAVESAHHVQEILDANRPQSGKSVEEMALGSASHL